MNYLTACNLLDIELYNDFNYKKLRHNYYIKALNFQDILDAYEFLKHHKNIKDYCNNEYNNECKNDCNNEYNNECNNECNNEYSYVNILKQFMKVNDEKNIDIYKFLSIINNKYTKLSRDLLKQIPKYIIIKLHKFINSYSDILYINAEILTELDNLIYEHTKNDNMIFLIAH